MLFLKDIYAVKKVYETIYDEMNDPNQGFNDDNVYRKNLGGGWVIDHPDGSSTILVQGEPLIIPPREWLVKGVDGEWYDSNEFVEEDDISESSDSSSDSSSSDSSSTHSDNENDSEITRVFHYEMFEELSNKVQKCTSEDEVIFLCMEFVENNVPQNVWSTHESEIRNPESAVNSYLSELNNHINEGDEVYVFTLYQAAVCTYNTAQLLNVLDNDDLVKKVFLQTLK